MITKERNRSIYKTAFDYLQKIKPEGVQLAIWILARHY